MKESLHLNGRRLLLAGILIVSSLAVSALTAQDTAKKRRADTSSAGAAGDEDYLARRQATLTDIQAAQKKLAELKIQRIKLESRVDSASAHATEQRARTLLLTNEATGLRSLDSMLAVVQDNLLESRDRYLALGDAVRRRAAASLVIIVRVDSASAPARLDDIAVQVDSVAAVSRRYSSASLDALAAGAVDEIYRANILPSRHSVAATATIGGTRTTRTAAIEVPSNAVTYLELAIQHGQLVVTTWSNRLASER